MTRAGRARLLAATTAALGVVAAAVLSAPLAASASTLVSCPPTVQKLGTAYLEGFVDDHAGSFAVSLTVGSLPPGISIENLGYVASYKGTPTQLGSHQFTIQVVDDNHGDVQTKTCRVDVVAANSILGRIEGSDRHDVAATIALQMLAYGPTEKGGTVYIASGENYSDALSASAVAAQHDAPLLLTTAGQLPKATTDVLTILESTQIVVVGGENSVSAAVQAELAKRPSAHSHRRRRSLRGPAKPDQQRQLRCDGVGFDLRGERAQISGCAQRQPGRSQAEGAGAARQW